MAEMLELAGPIVAFFFTLMVLLYAFGDNPLFRLAVHIFIGAAAGYAGGVAIHAVIRPNLIDPLLALVSGAPSGVNPLVLVLQLALILLLSLKASARMAAFGNPAGAFLVGIGAAAAIGGAVQGTIFPQVGSAADAFQASLLWPAFREGRIGDAMYFLFSGIFVLVGTVTTLAYFHFSARSLPNQPPRRHRLIEAAAWVGRVFIAISFGAIFAGVYVSALSALIERFFFLWNVTSSFVFG